MCCPSLERTGETEFVIASHGYGLGPQPCVAIAMSTKHPGPDVPRAWPRVRTRPSPVSRPPSHRAIASSPAGWRLLAKTDEITFVIARPSYFAERRTRRSNRPVYDALALLLAPPSVPGLPSYWAIAAAPSARRSEVRAQAPRRPAGEWRVSRPRASSAGAFWLS